MEIGSQGEGGGTQVPNGRSSECQKYKGSHLNSFEGNKGGCQLQTKNQIRVVAYKMCLYLFCEVHDIHYIKCFMEKTESHLHTI